MDPGIKNGLHHDPGALRSLKCDQGEREPQAHRRGRISALRELEGQYGNVVQFGGLIAADDLPQPMALVETRMEVGERRLQSRQRR